MKTSATYKIELEKAERKKEELSALLLRTAAKCSAINKEIRRLKKRLQAAKKAERDPRNRFPFSRPAAISQAAAVAGV